MKKTPPSAEGSILPPVEGALAPDFTLPDQHGEEHSLTDYRGSWVLLYFYPKDDTPGCTIEACAFRDQHGEEHSLTDYRGSWVLLYFYPKDDTPGCTIEACAFRDQFKDFEKVGAVVLGVSTDSVESHRKFAAAFELPFTLLADVHKEVVGRYGVFGEKKFMGKTYMGTQRSSFLIDPKGIVRKVYPRVKPEIHAGEVIADLKAFGA